MIKSIIFDWGGVLAPSDNKIAAVRLRKNFDFDVNEFYKYFEEHEDNLCHTNEDKKFLLIASKKFNIPVGSIINALSADPPDEVFEIAKSLSKKYKTYILSNQLKFRTDYIKSTFDLSFFDKVFFSNEIGLKKPNKDIFNYLLKEIQNKPDECLFIDDLSENIQVAKKLEFNTILFKNLEQLKKQLSSFSLDY